MNSIYVKDGVLLKFQTALTENIYKDQNGYLVCEGAILGRTGIQEYTKRELGIAPTNEIVSVYRYEKDVFDSDSIASLEGRPLTLNHPNELVNADNHSKYAKGEVFNVRQDGDKLVGDIRVTDSKVIKLILDKQMRELSLGYTQNLAYDEESDTYFMTDIIYNHIALVKKGRAGISAIKDSEIEIESEGKENSMENEVNNAILEQLKALQEQLNGMNNSINANNDRLSALESKPQGTTLVQQTLPIDEPKQPTYVAPSDEQLNDMVAKIMEKLTPTKEETPIVEANTTIIETTNETPTTTKFDLGVDEKAKDRDIDIQKELYSYQKDPYESQEEYERRLSSLINTKSIRRQFMESNN